MRKLKAKDKIAGGNVVEKYIGGGGMAEVYKVRRLDGTQGALKFPKDSRYNSAFMKECTNWQAIPQHPNILRCLSVGFFEDGDKECFLVSEWMEGGTVGEWMEGTKGNLYAGKSDDQLARILHIATESAKGLCYMHRIGLKHKDIKPANILMSADGKQVKIADFGLTLEENKTHTVGYLTPAYAAPEQSKKTAGDTTSAVDVFSWGAMTLAMLIGDCTWQAGVEISIDFDDYINEATVKPSKMLVDMLRKCTVRDPKARPSFNDILRELGVSGGSQSSAAIFESPNIIIPKAEPPPLQEQYRYVTLPDGSNGVEFGSYPQGSKGEIAPIQWRILGKDKDGAALLLSDKILDCVKYHRSVTDIQWKDSDIRAWLNGEGEFKGRSFIETAFRPSERTAIIAANVRGNGVYSKDDLASTIDKVFLLNTDEARAMGSDDKCRWAQGTAYAKLAGNKKSRNLPNEGGELWVYDGRYDDGKFKDNSYWWLRNRGSTDPSFASRVISDGYVLDIGNPVDNVSGGVRPALRLNLT